MPSGIRPRFWQHRAVCPLNLARGDFHVDLCIQWNHVQELADVVHEECCLLCCENGDTYLRIEVRPYADGRVASNLSRRLACPPTWSTPCAKGTAREAASPRWSGSRGPTARNARHMPLAGLWRARPFACLGKT